jgi:diamine N-acetyltransferase
MNDIEFREINFDNFNEVVDLVVRPDQRSLIADNAYSIAQAFLDPVGSCRAAYFQGQPVGFFYTRLLEEGRLLYVCRFMVDQRQQGRGLGRKIMMKLLDTAFSSGSVDMVDLAVSREVGSAEAFYKQCGFLPTGEPYRGAWRMVLSKARYCELNSKVRS